MPFFFSEQDQNESIIKGIKIFRPGILYSPGSTDTSIYDIFFEYIIKDYINIYETINQQLTDLNTCNILV